MTYLDKEGLKVLTDNIHYEDNQLGKSISSIVGKDSYIIEGCGISATDDNSTLTISAGKVFVNGRVFDVEEKQLSVEGATDGYVRNDLIVVHVETWPSYSAEFVLYRGAESTTAIDPSYTQGDLNAGDTAVDMPLYRIPIDGITPGTPELMAASVPSLAATDEAVEKAQAGVDDSIVCYTDAATSDAVTLAAGAWSAIWVNLNFDSQKYKLVGLALLNMPNTSGNHLQITMIAPSLDSNSFGIGLRNGDTTSAATAKIAVRGLLVTKTMFERSGE